MLLIFLLCIWCVDEVCTEMGCSNLSVPLADGEDL